MTYPLDPYRPVKDIVADLVDCPENEGTIHFAQSANRAIHDRDPDALLVLALAYCIWRNEGLGNHSLSQLDAMMRVLERMELH